MIKGSIKVYLMMIHRQETDDDIISKKSLQVVKLIISFLKEHAREEGLFRRGGRRDLRRRILNSLKKGEKPYLGNNNVALECAAALQLYLGHLKKPVMPQHIQQLLLGNRQI
ncbi:rho GTPase-activating protein 22-like [Ceratina calcarata]|uniref:Rho GTPase-activating protein 22-like n=1 Tax=Ceratina calcarata TaxID=156304 RepID=A0AAJ7RZ61_9HYME|nr:rho GTPase-activating protein 22-like [Ceratina calcarata]